MPDLTPCPTQTTTLIPTTINEASIVYCSTLSLPIRGAPYAHRCRNPCGHGTLSGADVCRQEIEDTFTRHCEPAPLIPSSPSTTSKKLSSGSSSGDKKKHSPAQICPTCSANPSHFYHNCSTYQCFYC